MLVSFRVKILRPTAKLPAYAHPGDAGMDLFAPESVTISAHERVIIPMGISFEFPEGYVALIMDKGGPSAKYGLTTLGGVVDAGYRGELMVTMLNTTDTDYTFAPGDKIAQLLIQPVVYAEISEVAALSDHERGEGRFGSTGK